MSSRPRRHCVRGPEQLEPRDLLTIAAVNASEPTLCAEHDNVNVPLSAAADVAAVHSFRIVATHPTYEIGQDNGAANFDNCSQGEPGYPFTPSVVTLYDDGETVIVAVTEEEFWLPQGSDVGHNLLGWRSDSAIPLAPSRSDKSSASAGSEMRFDFQEEELDSMVSEIAPELARRWLAASSASSTVLALSVQP
jgi:hypothetical protein